MAEQVVQRAPKRGIWGWMLFDFAQQPFHTLIITFVFAPYFAAKVASNPAEGQEYWGYAAGIGGAIIALTSPILGAIADASGPRKPWILLFSILGFIGCWMLWYATPGMGNLGFAVLAIVIALVGMEYAAVFNNAMMPTLVPRSELGRLSGSAWGLGYVGGLISLVIVLGFLSASPETGKTLLGVSPLFGLDPATHEGDRASGPLTSLWYLIFVLPMFLWTPDVSRRGSATGAVRRGLAELWETLRTLPSQRSYFSFLLSSMFYRDALNALYSFGGIYAAGVLGWPIIKIGIFGILANLTGAVGAWIGGRADQRFGPKPVISVSILILILWCVTVISTTKTEVLFMTVAAEGSGSTLPDIVFYIAGAFIGAAGGSIQAASRTLLVDQVEGDKVTEAFGLYALSGRATSFIAPFAIAFATAWFASEAFNLSTQDAQRLGVTPIVALFVIGLVLLPWIRSREYKPAEA
ncbi:MFS transporter [Mesorhizobium australicum]|uniref:MFS transporter, UMF1 family n=1 Tax=Mesorhizobium australicum TaxID=536018 RepID=A0A1X7NCZ8_9HYPH|nr:MFS transporter [Mesorhizobium australicum]SMH35565.1 MFS transporter, UMF1 family [Mesorhizobium australicum]